MHVLVLCLGLYLTSKVQPNRPVAIVQFFLASSHQIDRRRWQQRGREWQVIPAFDTHHYKDHPQVEHCVEQEGRPEGEAMGLNGIRTGTCWGQRKDC